MLRIFFLFLSILFLPGLFLGVRFHLNHDYEIGCAYDWIFMTGNAIWDFILVYLIYRFLSWLWRLCVRLLCWFCRLLGALICRLYYHCRARADRRGKQNE